MTTRTKVLTLLTVSALSLSFNAHAMGSKKSEDILPAVNKNTFEGNWNQLKGSIQEQWGKLTNDDMDQINGNIDAFYGKIQEYYGESKEAINAKLDKLMK